MADNAYSPPERSTERALARRKLSAIYRAGGCGMCRHAVHGWGKSACDVVGRTFPLCLHTPGPQFELAEEATTVSKRAILDSISTIRPTGVGANSAAIAVRRIVNEEGPQCVSVDDDGEVFATPRDCDFSAALLRSYPGHVVGVYDKHLDLDHLSADLAAHVQSQAA